MMQLQMMDIYGPEIAAAAPVEPPQIAAAAPVEPPLRRKRNRNFRYFSFSFI